MAEALPAAGAQRPPAQNLDELMLAMDVVDTLRHQDNVVTRELDEGRRDAQLIERLREIYRSQGIAVPDRVLEEGVKALKESRFVYTPPSAGFSRTLAMLWIGRGRLGRALMALVGAILLAIGVYQFAVVRPAEQRAEQARMEAQRQEVEITQRLPRALEAGHAEVLAEAKVPAARERADRILADGRAALARREVAGAEQALGDLEDLRAELRREYVVRIVSRPGEQTGVWRIPDRNPNARNYYLIVEAVTPDGRALSLPITSEEDRGTAVVSRWGIRVSPEIFEDVRRDKSDDGIVQRDRLGEKRRGYLDIDYAMPVLGGFILKW